MYMLTITYMCVYIYIYICSCGLLPGYNTQSLASPEYKQQ